MRDCANVEVRDLLPELLHERLGASEREHVLTHVASCVDCTAELSLLRAALAASTADVPRVDPALIAQQVLARLHATPSAPRATPALVPDPHVVPLRPRRPVWGRGTLRAAAAALIMVAGTGVVLYERGGPDVDAASSSPATLDSTPASTSSPSRPIASAIPAAPGVAESASRSTGRSVARPAAQSALGASFDDLSDDELAAVLDAVETTDRGPAADPTPAPTIVTSGEVL